MDEPNCERLVVIPGVKVDHPGTAPHLTQRHEMNKEIPRLHEPCLSKLDRPDAGNVATEFWIGYPVVSRPSRKGTVCVLLCHCPSSGMVESSCIRPVFITCSITRELFDAPRSSAQIDPR